MGIGREVRGRYVGRQADRQAGREAAGGVRYVGSQMQR